MYETCTLTRVENRKKIDKRANHMHVQFVYSRDLHVQYVYSRLAHWKAEYRKREQRAWEAIMGVFHKRRKIGAATNQQESPPFGVYLFFEHPEIFGSIAFLLLFIFSTYQLSTNCGVEEIFDLVISNWFCLITHSHLQNCHREGRQRLKIDILPGRKNKIEVNPIWNL